MTYTIQQLKGGTDNCYLVTDGTNAVLVDTSSGESREMVMDACSKYDLKLVVGCDEEYLCEDPRSRAPHDILWPRQADSAKMNP